MRCPRCTAFSGRNDNFCANCGLALRNLRPLPVKRDGNLPVVWRRAAPTLVQGVAVLALGALAEWALRSLARQAWDVLPSLLSPPKPAKASRLPVKKEAYLPEPEGTYAVSETVVMRRLTLRR